MSQHDDPMSRHDAAPPPPPPTSQGSSFRLLRARTDRKLGGVAGGLAAAAGLDPTLVRMGMAVGALTGWLVLAYLIAWLVIPEEDETAGRPLLPASEDTARLLRIVLAVIAGLGALQIAGIVAGFAFAVMGTVGALFDPFIDPFAGDFGGFNPDFPVRGVAGLVLLAGGGLFLLRHRTGRETAPEDGDAPSSPAVPSSPPPPPSGAAPAPGAADAPGEPGGRNWRSPGEWLLLATRAAGWLLALWFAVAGAVLAGLWAFDAVRLRFPVLLALATLAALGLMGTVLVRSRRPALLAAAAAALLVPTVLTLALARWNGVAGYWAVAPSSVTEVPEVYRHAAGEFRLNLSELSLPAGTTEISVQMGAGEVEVTVPWDVSVAAATTVGVGEFNLLGRSQAGLSLEGEVRDQGEPGAPTLRIDGRTGAGQFKIFRQAPPATKIALDAGQAVRLECRSEPEGVRCVSPDGYSMPEMDCLISTELENVCRPRGEPLPDDTHPSPGRPGTRRCTVPAGGGLAVCEDASPASPAQTPAEGTPPSMPPGTYVCDFPAGGGPATCRPA